MKYFIWISVLLLFCLGSIGLFKKNSTPSEFSISEDNIKVVRTDQHPFLVDHSKLIIVEVDSRRIDEMKGYSDFGSGCNSHLFEEEKTYALIDCNGTKFSISKAEGKIETIGWSWMNELPETYIGIYERQRGKVEYSLSEAPYPDLKDVYVFKDPTDY